MRSWLESIAGPEYASALIWTLGALILLLVVLVAVRIFRGLTFGTFVAGGRNRKTRLAVMDAAAVDSHRRLVLVRRDDIEHLLLIGGPTDVVIEQNIRLAAPMRRPQAPEARELPKAEEAAPKTAEIQRATPPSVAVPSPAPRPSPNVPSPANTSPAPSYVRPQPVAPPPAAVQTPKPAPYVPQPSFSAAQPQPLRAATPISTASSDTRKPGDLDDALLKELEVTLNEKAPAADTAKPKEVDDEMSRLLGDLSMKREK